MDAGGGQLSQSIPILTFLAQNAGVLVLLLVLIVFSAYFSGAETAISASNKIKLRSEAEGGDRRARKMLRLSDTGFEKTLTTVLFGNDLVNIATGSVTTLLALRIGIPETVGTLCVTAIVILFGEVLPKTVVKSHVDRSALSYAPSLSVVCMILSPFAALFSVFSRIVSRFFAPKNAPTVTEDDVHDIIEDIDESGAAGKDEINLLYSAFEFDDVTIGDIYTAYEDVVAVDIDHCAPDALVRLIEENMYSRMPVFRGNKDNVIGVLRVRTFLEAYVFDHNTDIEAMLDPPMPVDLSMPADELLQLMQKVKSHMAIVKTQGGRTLGIVTIEDLLEELVGEIFDENDVVEDKFRVLAADTYEVSADLSVVSAFELMEYEDYDRDECGHETLLMWATPLHGSKMHRGDTVRYGRLTVTAEKIRHGKPDKFNLHVDRTPDGEVTEP